MGIRRAGGNLVVYIGGGVNWESSKKVGTWEDGGGVFVAEYIGACKQRRCFVPPI